MGRTDAKALFRAAVRDLIERRVLMIAGDRGTAIVVTLGPEPAPTGRLSSTALRLVLRTPPAIVGGGFVRDLSEVARGVAGDAAARRALVQAALDDLVESGWATVADRRVLGVPRRPRYRRSVAGDAVLAARRGRLDGGGDSSSAWAATSTHGHRGGRDDEDDGDDRSGPGDDLDPAFDEAFDTSFDSGYAADGASDGDGGDGGGGD